MAPIRRRLSKRVVKSTFQECFEYDVPGFRSAEPKRVNLTEVRNRSSTSDKSKDLRSEKVSSDKNVNQISKTKTVVTKDTPKDESPKKRGIETTKVKGKDSIKVKRSLPSKPQTNNKKLIETRTAKLLKVQKSVASRMKSKAAFLGSDYKRFKIPQIKSKTKNKTPVPKKTQMKEEIVEEEDESGKTVSEVSKNTSSSTGKVLESTNWQPVVHLEKISVGDSKALKSNGKDKEISLRQNQLRSSPSKSPDLATRLRNALKDPLAEREDNESGVSDNEISKSMQEVFASTLSHAGTSQSMISYDSAYGGTRNLRSSVLESVFRDDVLPKEAGSDSALEDWPESSSENEDAQTKDENILLDDILSPSAITSWSGPHVNVILQWQKQFHHVANELRNTLDGLKSIIEEKNSLIAALKSKLDSFSDSTCHKILDRILLDYDKHDPKKPATMIINSILEY